MKEKPQKPKATTEQKIAAYKKIAEWTKQVDPEESKRILEMLKDRKKNKL